MILSVMGQELKDYYYAVTRGDMLNLLAISVTGLNAVNFVIQVYKTLFILIIFSLFCLLCQLLLRVKQITVVRRNRIFQYMFQIKC